MCVYFLRYIFLEFFLVCGRGCIYSLTRVVLSLCFGRVLMALRLRPLEGESGAELVVLCMCTRVSFWHAALLFAHVK